MAPGPGARLGVYEVTARIGEGGMGQVFRARDTRLQRDVALKVLPDSFASDPGRLARFQREAQLLASLNHPHIAAIHGMEDGGDHRAIVMELVEGETLGALLRRGPLPVVNALRLARQVADAVEYAHDHGVIHRDLKPENIIVSADGTAKVLDFGLAKALDDASGAAPVVDGRLSPTMTPTMTIGATQAGVILGTAAYMAPEQAKGRTADRRSDVWAFGVVLYEMLTGRGLFAGDTVAETLASVMKDAPALGALPADTPGAVRRLIARCLERDPRRRVQAMGEARIVIEDAIAGVRSDADAGSVSAPARSIAARAPWLVAAALLLALATLAWTYYSRPAPPGLGLVHLTIAPPEGTTLPGFSPQATNQAVSPDGRHVAFLATEPDGTSSIHVRPLASLAAQTLSGTGGAEFPFWSPDSRFIAFFQAGKLRRVPVSGGSPLTVADAPEGEGGTWSRDGVIVFAPTQTGPLHRVPAAGGLPTPVTALGDGETGHNWPWFLPDGQRFLYLSESTDPAKRGLYVQSLGSAERTFVMSTLGRGIVVESGRAGTGLLIFMRESTVLAQPIHLGTLQVQGEPVAVAEDVRMNQANGRNAFSVSANGVMVDRGSDSDNQLVWYGRTGAIEGVVLPPGSFPGSIAMSPDERRVAIRRPDAGGGNQLWLLDLESRAFSRLTTSLGDKGYPEWSPDSRRVAFFAQGKGRELRETVVGSGVETTLLADGRLNILEDWSPDGRTLLFTTGSQAYELSLEQDAKPRPVFRVPPGSSKFRLSPDGRWVAYQSTETGQTEIYLARYPSLTDRRQISSGGAAMPRWRRDGRELFYGRSDRTIAALDVRPGDALETGTPTVLFPTNMGINPNAFNFTPTADGQRFLVREAASRTTGVEPLHVILNWPAALGSSF